MTSPSDAFNKAIAGVNDFMTSPAKKAALTYNSGKPASPTINMKDYRQTSLKAPRGSMIGSPKPLSSQEKALLNKQGHL
jgi:hypothetical protein